MRFNRSRIRPFAALDFDRKPPCSVYPRGCVKNGVSPKGAFPLRLMPPDLLTTGTPAGGEVFKLYVYHPASGSLLPLKRLRVRKAESVSRKRRRKAENVIFGGPANKPIILISP